MRHNARNTDPQPSHAAATVNRSGRWSHRMIMLDVYANPRALFDGYTDHEAARRAGIDVPGVCWWHRASDLRAAGLIEWATNPDGSRITRRGENGVNVGVSVITRAGITAWREHRKAAR